MDSRNFETLADNDEAAIRAIPYALIDAWNHRNGARFAAPFGSAADFVAFEGTHLRGRQAIAEFHQSLFDTALKGTRLHGDVRFVHAVAPHVAVMHATAGTTLTGAAAPSPSRDSMQLFVAVNGPSGWQIEALLNARRLTLERQRFLDGFDALSEAAQHEVLALIEALK